MKNSKIGYVYILVVAFLFSTMEIVLKTMSGSFNPVQLTFSRFFIGGLVLLPFALRKIRRGGLRFARKDWAIFAFLGFLGMTVSMTLYQIGVAHIKASTAAILFSSNPVFVALLALLILREPIGKPQLLALAFDVIGVLIIVNPFGEPMGFYGVGMVLAGTAIFALYSVLGKRSCGRYGGLVVTCMGFLFGSLEMIAFSALTHIPAVAQAFSAAGMETFARIPFFQGHTLALLPGFLYVCIGVTGLGFFCYFKAMEETSAVTASLVFFLKPVLSPILALLLIGEKISLQTVIGVALIFIGSMASMIPGLLAGRKKAA
ncbi:MAG: DMT family transporter [Oscillospiraceae bacterium]|nr:DMT family transporter [Oscillospiraceae bacterium]